MQSLLDFELGLGLLAFGIACGAGTALWKQARVGPVRPVISGRLRIRASHGMYRSRLVALTPQGWQIQAPLQRDHYVPLRPGDDLIVEAPTPRGVVAFRSTVVSRESEHHTLILQPPDGHAKATERRLSARFPIRITVRSRFGVSETIDVSEGGLRVAASWGRSGDRVDLEIEEWGISVRAEILAGDGLGTRMRWDQLSAERAKPFLQSRQRSRKSRSDV